MKNYSEIFLTFDIIEQVYNTGVACTNRYKYNLVKCTDAGMIIQRTDKKTKSVSYIPIRKEEYPENLMK